jgi:hypothetical protein
MRLMSKMMVLAAASTLAIGCGDDDSLCGDAACPDGGVTPATDGPMQWGLTSGKTPFVLVGTATGVMDGCNIGVAALTGLTFPVTYSRDLATIEIGDPKGSPAMPSLGKGMIAGNTATLTRDNKGGDGVSCFWDQKDTSLLTLIGHDQFTLAVTETQSGIAAACSPKPPTDPCTSSWTWTLKKQ